MAFCIHCGKQLVEGARFCAFCGQSTSGNIALQRSNLGSAAPVPVEVALVVSQPAENADKIIAHLRDHLGMDAEMAEDGGVRVTKQRYNKDIGMFELHFATTQMTTPSGYKAKGIVLPEGVTEIADEAFYMAWGLEYVELPSTLRKIGEDAFDDTDLVEVVIPEGVTEVGAGLFHDCTSMKKATIKCPMRVMPAALFMACEALEEVILPANLEEIESEAFEQCSKLKKLHLPTRLKAVGRGAFYECPVAIIRQVKAAFPAYKD